MNYIKVSPNDKKFQFQEKTFSILDCNDGILNRNMAFIHFNIKNEYPLNRNAALAHSHKINNQNMINQPISIDGF